ncbi:MarR family winged helix-turn-helix transcriptional regulator [Arthrobacter sp. JSM 101049]|uniref:MarR family winged helix-turn-helix transcriptional regulator n=1 Tax=Arthrobacter sp. JSM 101049 TaxID=929097 RepID=UPI003567DD82
MDNGAHFQLVRLLQEFTQASDRFVDATSGGNSMHRSDLNALSVVMRHEQSGQPPTASALGRELHLSPPATTALVNRLERSGHVVRRRSETDRRVVRIAVTDHAVSEGRRMFAPLARALSEAIAAYPEADIAVISRFMADAARAVDGATQNLDM